MLVNPEGETRHHKKRPKYLQIVFPKPVRRIKANPEYLETARTKGKALIGRFTGKHVAGALGGAAATIAIPKAAGLKDWGDVIGSGAVAIGGGIAVKQVDEGAGDAFMLTGLGVAGLKAVKQLIKTAKGQTGRKKRRYRSLGEDELLGIEDLGEEELLGDEDILGDVFGEAEELLDVGDVADFGEEVIET